jgi:hypothetical protein
MESKFLSLSLSFLSFFFTFFIDFSQLADVRRPPSAFGRDWTNRRWKFAERI